MKDLVEGIAKSGIPLVIQDLYKDLIQPGAKELGKALGTALASTNTLLLPVSYVNKSCYIKFQKRLRKLDDQLKLENQSEICSVPNEIGVPALEKLFYITSDELADLYINLLKRASMSDEANLAHPNFVNVLSSLSPDEARIIDSLRGNPISFISLGYEISEERIKGYSTNVIERTNRIHTDLPEKIDLIFPQNFHIYNINMFSLGLVDSMSYVHEASEEHIAIEKKYSSIVNAHRLSKSSTAKFDSPSKAIVEYGNVRFTEFGKMFIDACCKVKA